MLKVLSPDCDINQGKPSDTVASDRRQQYYDQSILWEKLNLSQQYSTYSLSQFGYLLTYVRYLNDQSLAILKLDNKVATINETGDINISPYIICR
jgi:hypothetical protein